MKLSNGIMLICLVFLFACDKGSSDTVSAGPDGSLTPTSTSATEAPIANNESHANEAPDVVQPSAVAELAMLSEANLSVDSPELSSILDKYFKDGCSAGSAPLTFEQTCQYYSENSSNEDPSPWPELMIAISSKEVASAVLFNSSQSLGENWHCDSSKDLVNVRYCYPKNITAENRERWSKQWTAFFASAD
jgi:hypothetical protein